MNTSSFLLSSMTLGGSVSWSRNVQPSRMLKSFFRLRHPLFRCARRPASDRRRSWASTLGGSVSWSRVQPSRFRLLMRSPDCLRSSAVMGQPVTRSYMAADSSYRSWKALRRNLHQISESSTAEKSSPAAVIRPRCSSAFSRSTVDEKSASYADDLLWHAPRVETASPSAIVLRLRGS